MVATVRCCGRVEALALEHVDHAEHAVHRRADFVAHGGEEGRLRLVGGLGLGAFALGLGSAISAASRASACSLLAPLEFGDVAIDAEQAAVRERLVGELDVRPLRRPPLVARAARRAHHGGAFLHGLFDIVGLAEVAALAPDSG